MVINLLSRIRAGGGLSKYMIEGLNPVFFGAAQLYSKHRDPDELYRVITREASALAKTERASLMLLDRERNVLRLCAATGLEPSLIGRAELRAGEDIAGKVCEDGKPILLDSDRALRRYIDPPRPGYKTCSSLSLPLGFGEDIIGVLNLSDKCSGEPFRESDLLLLSGFALQTFFILKLSSSYMASEHMRLLSTTDFLTGLFNRRYFNIRMNEEYRLVKRLGGLLSLAILDIDDFKLFNDTEGHPSGDRILKEIASVMAATVRANDILVRFGGEEFAVIMPQTSEAEAFNLAERIRRNVKHSIPRSWKKFPKEQMTLCAGIAVHQNCQDPIEALVERADRALYTAKLQGKDRTVLYSAFSPEYGDCRSQVSYLREVPSGFGAGSLFPLSGGEPHRMTEKR